MREWFGFSKKDGYTPSEAKRYEISEDSFSRARIQALRDIHHSLEKEYNISLSFSIFGSLVKGKLLNPETATRADIDMWIDVDEETLANDPVIRRQILQRVRDALIIQLNDKEDTLGFSKIQTGHIQIRVLNNQSIPAIINQLLQTNFLRVGRKLKEIELSTFFTLSIGNPIKKYRNQFLASLRDNSDSNKARLIWQLIKTVVENTERKGEAIPKEIKKQFPDTLEEALKFYGVK